jgi:hypothetical protein
MRADSHHHHHHHHHAAQFGSAIPPNPTDPDRVFERVLEARTPCLFSNRLNGLPARVGEDFLPLFFFEGAAGVVGFVKGTGASAMSKSSVSHRAMSLLLDPTSNHEYSTTFWAHTL